MSQAQLKALYAPRLAKFILMNLTTVSLYNIYWGYRNWKAMKESGRTSAPASLCGLFLPVTLFSLLGKVKEERAELGASAIALMTAQVGFLILHLMKALPIVGVSFLFISFLALIPINQFFGRINAKNENVHPEIYGFNSINIAWIACIVIWNVLYSVLTRL